MGYSDLLKGRVSAIGQVYTITTVTHDRTRHFENPANAAILIHALRYVEHYKRTRSLAWVVMPDHLHWLVRLRRGDLAECMKLLKWRSAVQINHFGEGAGRIWQPGYYDHALRRQESLRTQARYILANPVRAGLTRAVGEYPYAWCRWQLDAGRC